MKLIILAAALSLTACDLFSQCDPTPDQHDMCEWRHGWAWFAVGQPRTDGICRDTDFLCSNGREHRAPLTAGDGGLGGAGGAWGQPDADCIQGDASLPDGGPDSGPPICQEPDAGLGVDP